MEQQWQHLAGNDGYVVIATDNISGADLATITRLYQPIVGPGAVGLYATLQTTLTPEPLVSERRPLKDLFVQLNFGIEDLATAAQQLVQVNLLQVVRQHDQLGNWVLLVMNPPLSPTRFFDDPQLSERLTVSIGTGMAAAWKRELSFNTPAIQQLLRQAVGDQVRTKQSPIWADVAVTLPATNPIDFEFVDQLLHKKTYLDTSNFKQNIRVAYSVGIMYGLNELALVNLIDSVADEQGHVDFNQLSNQAMARYSSQAKVGKKRTAADQTSTEVKLIAAEQNLATAAKAYPPMAFLQTIFEQKNAARNTASFPTRADKYVVQNLLQQGIAPGVINIMLHYYLVDQNFDNLRASTVERTISNWGANRVRTPEQAIVYVRQWKEKRTQDRTARRQKQRVFSKEKLPQWAQTQAQTQKPAQGKRANAKAMGQSESQTKNDIDQGLADLDRLLGK